jgi:hypothetical protein
VPWGGGGEYDLSIVLSYHSLFFDTLTFDAIPTNIPETELPLTFCAKRLDRSIGQSGRCAGAKDLSPLPGIEPLFLSC